MDDSYAENARQTISTRRLEMEIYKRLPFLLISFLMTNVTYAQSQMEELSSIHITGNVLLANQYNFRGVSMTNRKPAIQGGINFSHKSGAYLNLWASNQNVYPESSIEADIFLGYIWSLSEHSYLDIGVVDVNYVGSPSELNADFNEFNLIYNRVNLFMTKDKFSAALYFSPDYTTSSGKEYYTNISYSYPLNNTFNLFGSAGYTLLENKEKFLQVFGGEGTQKAYVDYKIGVRATLKGLDAELSWIDTTIDTPNKNMQGTFYFSVGKSF
ncbi:TorF family putative porin [Acinetobacter baumannii]|uniref:TorF family putative porin n=1 Tax=Acinetobacter baumannii TaxID=470 RepID=UPI0029583190|nr:TorF family putative porin [Acinetobacter baumannii]